MTSLTAGVTFHKINTDGTTCTLMLDIKNHFRLNFCFVILSLGSISFLIRFTFCVISPVNKSDMSIVSCNFWALFIMTEEYGCKSLGLSQWQHSLRRWSAAARLLGLWFESHQGHGYLSVVSVCVVS
jgi:hypothetical protein